MSTRPRPGGARRSTTNKLSSIELRTRLAGRPASPSELAAAGFTVKVALQPSELLHLHRRRLAPQERSTVVAAVGASHVVGDDCLSPSNWRHGPLLGDFWRMAPKYSWGDASFPHPLVVFPDSLTRLRERVCWELQQHAVVQAITVLVTFPRVVIEQCHDWESFENLTDSILVQQWGEGIGVSAATVFPVPLKVLRFPSQGLVIPPAEWVQEDLPLKTAAVALRIERRSSTSAAPVFQKIGTYPTLVELQATDRQGLARVALEVDLLQRPRTGKGDVGAFARRALSQLIGATSAAPVGLPCLPVRGLSQRGDMLRGFADLPAILATKVLQASGAVRGVFARPWLGAESSFPLPEGFGASSHRVIWAKVERFSDIVVESLRAAKVEFDGLVCPRSKGELGIRVRVDADISALRQCLESYPGAHVKARAVGLKTRLRLVGVPLALMCSVERVVQFLNPTLKLVDQRVIRTSFDSMTVDAIADGPPLLGSEWRVPGLGSRVIVVKRLPPRQSPVVASRLPPTSRVPPPRRPLTTGEQVSWAGLVRGEMAAEAAPMDGIEGAVGESSSSSSTSSSTISPTPVLPPAPMVLIADDAEIPLPSRSRRQGKAVMPSASASSSCAVASFPATGPSRAKPPQKPFQKRIDACFSKTAPSEARSSCSSSSGSGRILLSSSNAAPPQPTPYPSSVAAIPSADSRVAALEAKVDILLAQLQQQISLNTQLQAKLDQVLAQNDVLTVQIRSIKSKRSHSASACIASPGKSSSGEVDMQPASTEDGVTRRRTDGGSVNADGGQC